VWRAGLSGLIFNDGGVPARFGKFYSHISPTLFGVLFSRINVFQSSAGGHVGWVGAGGRVGCCWCCAGVHQAQRLATKMLLCERCVRGVTHALPDASLLWCYRWQLVLPRLCCSADACLLPPTTMWLARCVCCAALMLLYANGWNEGFHMRCSAGMGLILLALPHYRRRPDCFGAR
jgi:hypothetical protein